MVRVFQTMAEYVAFLASLPIAEGEKVCLPFMPSAFFPKDAVGRYFSAIDPIAEHSQVTEDLWMYGKDLLRSIDKQQVELCIEPAALRTLCEGGGVHPTSPTSR